MVLVAVGQQNRVHPAFAETLVVWDHPLDAVVPLRKHLARVDQKTILARLEKERVHAELAQSPDRCDSEIGIQGWVRSTAAGNTSASRANSATVSVSALRTSDIPADLK